MDPNPGSWTHCLIKHLKRIIWKFETKYNWNDLNLGKKDYELEYHGKRESCVSDCSSYGNDPYCANGKTYNNKCLMYNDVCTKGIAPGTKGACGKDYNILHVEIRRSIS